MTKSDARMRAKKLTITFHIFLFFAVVLGSRIVDVNIDPVLGYNGGVGFGIAHGVDEHELLWINLRCVFGLGLLWLSCWIYGPKRDIFAIIGTCEERCVRILT